MTCATALYDLLIYPLYDPDHFTDKSYIRTNVDWIDGTAEYTVQIRIPSNTPDGSTRTLDCTNFRAISARNPFTTRTHVLSNASFPHSKGTSMARLSLC